MSLRSALGNLIADRKKASTFQPGENNAGPNDPATKPELPDEPRHNPDAPSRTPDESPAQYPDHPGEPVEFN